VTDLSQVIDQIYRSESRRILATLIRLLKDFDLAEEAMHEAFAVASANWPSEGIPDNPRAWLISTARFKAIDLIRRGSRFKDLEEEVRIRVEQIADRNARRADLEIEDDQLRLIFTCCHPAIDPKIQVPLTLREVCGLTTEEIARAFLTTPSTMAQRIVRGKAKIKLAKIPYIIPSVADLPERLDAVLTVIYLIFNESYSASVGNELIRKDLAAEAIRLARTVLQLQPGSEMVGLLALMLLHQSRSDARVSETGEIVTLEFQDRALWNRQQIDEGKQLIQQAIRTGRVGFYTIQAAISAVHADANSSEETDWTQIVALYDLLKQIDGSPIVELNRAVAVAMRDVPSAGLALIDDILSRGQLQDYHLAHSARGELLGRIGNFQEAKQAFESALQLAKLDPEKIHIEKRIAEISLALAGENRGP